MLVDSVQFDQGEKLILCFLYQWWATVGVPAYLHQQTCQDDNKTDNHTTALQRTEDDFWRWISTEAESIRKSCESAYDIPGHDQACANVSQERLVGAGPKGIKGTVRADGQRSNADQDHNDLGEAYIQPAVQPKKVRSQSNDQNQETE